MKALIEEQKLKKVSRKIFKKLGQPRSIVINTEISNMIMWMSTMILMQNCRIITLFDSQYTHRHKKKDFPFDENETQLTGPWDEWNI